MSLWLDEKFLRLLSPQLDHFVQKHPHVFNFRCPLCGDSEQNKRKARGYCFPKATTLIYKCHNCGIALPFAALLKRTSRRLFDEYMLEKLRDEKPAEKSDEDIFGETFANVTDGASTLAPTTASPYITALSEPSLRQPGASLYPVYDYVRKRLIPDEQMGRLWATIHAYTYLSTLVGEDKAAKVKDGEPYLILPLTHTSSTWWYGAQFRLLTRKEYITYKWSEHETLKVFGLDRWIPAETTYIVEGPLDSLFLPNAIAACSSDLMGVITALEERQVVDPRDSRVFVWDNEPRNKEITRLMRQAITMREQIVIWPREYPKDINDMVRAGIDVQHAIATHTFQGLRADLEFQRWKI